MNLKQLHDQLGELNRTIGQILAKSGFDVCNDLYGMEGGFDPDSLMLREELTDVLNHLEAASNILTYLNKRVVGESTLYKKSNGRYGCETTITSDCVIQDSILIAYQGEERNVVIPQGIWGIGERVFECSNIESIVIPDGVIKIENHAFQFCSDLKSVSFPDGLLIIGKGAFTGCDRLEKITLPKDLVLIDDEAFAWCKSLTSVVIPDNVKFICDRAFAHCTSLTDVVIPKSARIIGCKTFDRCTNLKSLSLPDSYYSLSKKSILHSFFRTFPFVGWIGAR